MAKIKKVLSKEFKLPFGLSESSLSMILGGLVVVFVALLAFNFFKTQQVAPNQSKTKVIVTNNSNGGKSISLKEEIVIATQTASPKPTVSPKPTPSASPSPKPTASPKPSATPSPSPKPSASPTKTPTKAPTVSSKPSQKPTATKSPSPKPTATQAPKKGKIESGKSTVALPTTHTVAKGENLWVIAEKYFGSGYNDVDIVSANKLSNPSLIFAGQKLAIPKVEARAKTVTENEKVLAEKPAAITESKYVVKTGDDLWSIAVRSYGDGYRYVEIARVNKITNPSLIFKGDVLVIPRK